MPGRFLGCANFSLGFQSLLLSTSIFRQNEPRLIPQHEAFAFVFSNFTDKFTTMG